MSLKLDLSKVTPEASQYLIERWEIALSTDIPAYKIIDLENHIDAHLIHMGKSPKYEVCDNNVKTSVVAKSKKQIITNWCSKYELLLAILGSIVWLYFFFHR